MDIQATYFNTVIISKARLESKLYNTAGEKVIKL